MHVNAPTRTLALFHSPSRCVTCSVDLRGCWRPSAPHFLHPQPPAADLPGVLFIKMGTLRSWPRGKCSGRQVYSDPSGARDVGSPAPRQAMSRRVLERATTLQGKLVLPLRLADSSVLVFFIFYVGCAHRSAPSIQPLCAEMKLAIAAVFFP